MKFFCFCFIAVVLLSVTSCKNDLVLNAPYKEIPSIYAVLNPTDKIQMIRINKVFLGEGDANQMAKVSDSINYPERELTVMLERFYNGKKDKASASGATEIIFHDSLIQAFPGAFSTSQRVYVTSERLYDTGEYQLTITNNRTGNVFKAHAKPVQPVETNQFKPLYGPPFYPFPLNTPPEDYIDYSAMVQKNPYEIKYSISEAYAYQMFMRFYINEKLIGGGQADRLIDYNAGSRTLRDQQKISGLTFLSHTFTGANIFTAIANDLLKNKTAVAGRKLYRIDFMIYSSTQEYLDYLEYLKPSLSISQSKPLYSNFENSAALGIFTFRTVKVVPKQPSSVYVSSFSDNPLTCSYNFYDVNDVIRGCR